MCGHGWDTQRHQKARSLLDYRWKALTVVLQSTNMLCLDFQNSNSPPQATDTSNPTEKQVRELTWASALPDMIVQSSAELGYPHKTSGEHP